MREIIEKEVERLIKKHKTNDPFEIANAEHIKIYEEPLGTINGYYNKFVRQKMIHININLSSDHFKRLFTCGHELCHAVLHPNANTPFLRDNTYFSINKLEIQANLFSSIMIIPEDILLPYEGLTLRQIAYAKNIPIEILKLRFNLKE